MSEQIRISFSWYGVARVVDPVTQESLYVLLVENERRPGVERVELIGWWRQLRAWARTELPESIAWYCVEPHKPDDFRNTWIYASVTQAYDMIEYIQSRCLIDKEFGENAYDAIVREFGEEFIGEFTARHGILPVYSEDEIAMFQQSLEYLGNSIRERMRWEILNIYRTDFFEWEMSVEQCRRAIQSWCYIPLSAELQNTINPSWFDMSYYTFRSQEYFLGNNIVGNFWSLVDLLHRNWKNLATERQINHLLRV